MFSGVPRQAGYARITLGTILDTAQWLPTMPVETCMYPVELQTDRPIDFLHLGPILLENAVIDSGHLDIQKQLNCFLNGLCPGYQAVCKNGGTFAWGLLPRKN